jgi:hypothetical protein
MLIHEKCQVKCKNSDATVAVGSGSTRSSPFGTNRHCVPARRYATRPASGSARSYDLAFRMRQPIGPPVAAANFIGQMTARYEVTEFLDRTYTIVERNAPAGHWHSIAFQACAASRRGGSKLLKSAPDSAPLLAPPCVFPDKSDKSSSPASASTYLQPTLAECLRLSARAPSVKQDGRPFQHKTVINHHKSETVELEKYLILTLKRLQSAPILRHVPPRFDLSRLESPTPARLRTRHAGS